MEVLAHWQGTGHGRFGNGGFAAVAVRVAVDGALGEGVDVLVLLAGLVLQVDAVLLKLHDPAGQHGLVLGGLEDPQQGALVEAGREDLPDL